MIGERVPGLQAIFLASKASLRLMLRVNWLSLTTATADGKDLLERDEQDF